MKKIIIGSSMIWTITVLISLILTIFNGFREQKRISLETGRSFFNLIVITRDWNAAHGGVYVPVTRDTLPNPYLEVENKNLKINDNLSLTLVNPAFMTRQISEIAILKNHTQFHITSLKPIRPENKANLIETKSLKSFEKGIREVGEYIKNDGSKSFFYMAPLRTKKNCLRCHARQGYKVGEVRGGVSVTIPFVSGIPLFYILISHFIVGILGNFLIFYFGLRIKRSHEETKALSLYDEITKIPNRRFFRQEIIKDFSLCKRSKVSLSLIFCDIDYFKKYNDFYGHLQGDEILRDVASILQNSVNRAGDFCARFGGEEFVIILPDTTEQGAEIVAKRVQANFDKASIPHDKSLVSSHITISQGVTTVRDFSEMTYETLLQQADVAMYMAKDKGRNQFSVFVK